MDARSAGGFSQSESLSSGKRDRLLHDHVLTRRDRRVRQGGMRVVGCADMDDVDHWILEHVFCVDARLLDRQASSGKLHPGRVAPDEDGDFADAGTPDRLDMPRCPRSGTDDGGLQLVADRGPAPAWKSGETGHLKPWPR